MSAYNDPKRNREELAGAVRAGVSGANEYTESVSDVGMEYGLAGSALKVARDAGGVLGGIGSMLKTTAFGPGSQGSATPTSTPIPLPPKRPAQPTVQPQPTGKMGPPQPRGPVGPPAPASETGNPPTPNTGRATGAGAPSSAAVSSPLYAGVGHNGEPVFSNLPAGQIPAPNTIGVVPAYAGRSMPAAAGAGARPVSLPSASAPVMNPGLQEMREEMTALSQMITSGIGPNGRPLTADGMQALVSRANGLTRGLTGMHGDELGFAGGIAGDQADLMQQGVANEGFADRAHIAGSYGLLGQLMSGQGAYNNARANAINFELSKRNLSPARDLSLFDLSDPDQMKVAQHMMAGDNQANQYAAENNFSFSAAAAAIKADLEAMGPHKSNDPQTAQRQALLAEAYESAVARSLNEPQAGMAKGGVVQRFAEGGLIGGMRAPELGAPPGVDPQAIQRYQQYVKVMNSVDAPPVSFEEFLTMAATPTGAAGATPMPQMQPNAGAVGVLGMAGGGMVPDLFGGEQVDSKLVVDPDPNAPTDSIPAMIDGQQPAALDSGEFVIPKDVVMFYGTEKLNKLIEKARGGPEAPQGAPSV